MVLRTVVPGSPTFPLLCKSDQLCLSAPGLDYVSHEDILPYTSTDQVPIQHELFERFLLYDQTKGSLSLRKGEDPFFKPSISNNWEGVSGRDRWRVGGMPRTLVWTNPLSLLAPPFVARETLRAWQEKNHPWLELSDVHRETTENIRVTVIPFYMGMRVCASLGFFLQD